ncbi:MAG: trehalose-phosphatase [Stenotrophomonas sp.]
MLDDLQRPYPPALADDDALFLDVDGTLLAFADHPDKVAPDSPLLTLLASVQQRLDGALALLSGRPVSQLQSMFAPLRLPMAGLHGAQLLASPDARLTEPDTAAWLHALHQRAMQLAHAHPGVLIENKGQALAVHWRNAPQAGGAVIEFAQAQLPQLSGVRLQPGNHVIEFVGSGHDKGRALQQLMQHAPFKDRRPLFVGDDLTDEYGFEAAQQLGGIGVLVGRRESSQARCALPDISAVHAWLRAAIT